jgi:hypothetical protein
MRSGRNEGVGRRGQLASESNIVRLAYGEYSFLEAAWL